MVRFFITVILITIVLTSCAQQPKTQQEWIIQNTVELEKSNTYDFSEIKKAIGNKRIIALGESSHGLGKFYELKSELIKYLHNEMDFEVFAMEGGLGDINLAYSNIDTLTAKQLRDNTVFGNFRAKEVNSLFAHIKETHNTKNPLVFTGYDPQTSSSYMTKILKRILKDYNKTLADSLDERFSSYYKVYQAKDSINYYKYRNIFINTASEVKKILIENAETINITPFQLELLIRSMSNFERVVNHSYDDKYKLIEVRDILMAENVQWIADTLYPNKRIIIWAHNGHIEKGGSENTYFKLMGHYLKEKYADDYYALGLFAYKGEMYMQWMQEYMTFENSDSTFIEKKMMDSGKKVAYLNLEGLIETEQTTWLFNPVNANEQENGGVISFIPTKRFDGIISVLESNAPTFKDD